MTRLQRGILYALALELALVLIIYTGVACASSLYTAAHQAAGRQVTDPQRFTAIVGYPDQCVKGIPCWTYNKGTRTKNPHYPERWYLHVNGVRVKDSVFDLYVMDPTSTGWQHQVTTSCGKNCFLDGIGTSSLGRTTPTLGWSQARWVAGVTSLIHAITQTGKRVLPNSLSTDPTVSQSITDAAGRGSTEAYNPNNAQRVLESGQIWVQERGNCAAKYTAYQKYQGVGDHFACYLAGHLPWDTSWLSLTN